MALVFSDFHRILIGLIISLAVAVFSFKHEALSASGTIAAILVGELVFVFGGTQWFVLLAVFFLTSVFFTRFKARNKEEVVKEFAKGGVRDFWQVLANGGIAALVAIAFHYYSSPTVLFAFLGVMATVTADTWATELGILGKSKPRLITNWRPVRIGTSGAVSLSGTLSALAGAATIAIAFLATQQFFGRLSLPQTIDFAITAFAVIVFSGLAGAIADSLLGATLQAMYYCTNCKTETEKQLHYCGQKTTAIRGFKWFDNDIVNLVSSMIGGGVSAAIISFSMLA